MKNYVVAAGVLAATIVAVATPASARTTRERCAAATPAQVEALFPQFMSAWASKDAQTVTNLFAQDAVLLATVSNQPRTSPELVKDYFTGFLKNSPMGTINTSTVRVGCNIATRVGTWTVALTNPTTNATTNVQARYSFIYTHGRDGWKIYHLHSSAMPEVTS